MTAILRKLKSGEDKGLMGMAVLVMAIGIMVLFLIFVTKVFLELQLEADVSREMDVDANQFNSVAALHHIVSFEDNREKLAKHAVDPSLVNLEASISNAIYFGQGDNYPREWKVTANYSGQPNAVVKSHNDIDPFYDQSAYIASPKKKPANITVSISGQ